MKIVWYVNIIMPVAAEKLSLPKQNAGGWLEGQAGYVAQKNGGLVIVSTTHLVKEITKTTCDDIEYILIPQNNFENDMIAVLKQLSPQIVHIFGTEYKYNTQIVSICGDMNIKSVVSLQGIMYQCAKHYDDGLPEKFKNVNPLIKIMKSLYYADSIAISKKEFEEQGKLEITALKQTENVIGRTNWDKLCALQINPSVKYYHINENLRSAFYNGDTWSEKDLNKHTIFISQSFYPIKGFHQLLAIMPKLALNYPDLQVVVAGQKPYTLNNRWLDYGVDFFFEYQKYIKELIKKNNLSGYIKYTGSLNAQQMKEQLLRTNLFLSLSSIENSPNSIGEAMILGVPIVASDVGGVSTLLKHNVDGLLYDFFDKEGLYNSICKVFDNVEIANFFSENAKKHAQETHDVNINTQNLMNCYKVIVND